MGRPYVDITGQRFGRYTVLYFSGRSSGRSRAIKWLCRCDCGIEKEVVGSKLKNGTTVSCGCHRIEKATRHGQCKQPEYMAYSHMKARCLNRNNTAWKHYGGRGISVCQRWLDSFEDFLADMGVRPSPSHTFGRIDNDGNYCPENCRWETMAEQNLNKRTSRLLTLGNETKTLAEWCSENGADYKRVEGRLRLGWDLLSAILTPRLKKGSQPTRHSASN